MYTEPDAHFSLEEEICDTCVIHSEDFEIPDEWFEKVADEVLETHKELLERLSK